MKKRNIVFCICVVCIAMILPTQVFAADAKEIVQTEVNKVLAALKDPAFKEKSKEEKIAKIVQEHFDLSPKGIIQTLDLKRPVYRPTAAYGHFGRAPEDGLFTWEKTDRAAELKKVARRV